MKYTQIEIAADSSQPRREALSTFGKAHPLAPFAVFEGTHVRLTAAAGDNRAWLEDALVAFDIGAST